MYVFRISKIFIVDIKNNNLRYQKMNIYFGYPKLLFWISEIVIFISEIITFDIQNNYLRYQTLYRTDVLFTISAIVILDIKNNYFRHQK